MIQIADEVTLQDANGTCNVHIIDARRYDEVASCDGSQTLHIHNLPDLVKELVYCLLSQNLPLNSPTLNPNSLEFKKSLCYTPHILSSHLTPSVAPNAAIIIDFVKRHLTTHNRSFEAFSLVDLFSKFAFKA
ncbi:hypothetical protein VNO78_10344 [Psophocarpus tetragonolobus]|uniref:Uncharacterized protein n=1 Tax=Psophocarpus tetragonolobus TaxID=3891 RepID=A0AAN9SKL3_PSOTE